MDIKYHLRILKNTWLNSRIYLSLDGTYNAVSAPKFVSHSKWVGYLEQEFNKEGMKILEVGARIVTGSCFRQYFSKAEYIGFDFYKDNNVDIQGDAHKLSSYFKDDERFDLIFSTAVFEHLHMPWVVAQEIQKLLKVGGCVFIETVFSYSSHERPWNFFQFSDVGLRALFNRALGFEILDSGMSNPMGGYFKRESDKYLRYMPIAELYCHSGILCKKTREIYEFDWRQCDIDDVVDKSRYPLPVSALLTDGDRAKSELKWAIAQKSDPLGLKLINYNIPILSPFLEAKWVNRLIEMKFDDELYLKLNPDIRKADPKLHFIRHGSREGRHYRFLD
jgi:SAM-dependent methyltransferase